MPTMMLSPRRRSGSTRTSASEPIHRRGPLRNLADVELITADYVAWYNQQRLMHRLGRIPPAEAEAEYYDQLDASQSAGSQNLEGA
jgi:putative transposase